MIRLRDMTPADDPFFRRMEFETTWQSLEPDDRERLGAERVERSLRETLDLLLSRPGNRLVIAEDERGERVGLLWFGINRNLVTGEDEAWIYNVSVVESCQRRGVGRLLMEHAEKLAREGGFSSLGLMVACHNLPARALYERLAFRATNLLLRKDVSAAAKA